MTTATKTEPTVRVEYGVQRTWPDGHVEFEREKDRTAAERTTRGVNLAHEDGHNPATAATVTRTVTTTPWTQV